MTTTMGRSHTWQRKALALTAIVALFASLVTIYAPRADANDSTYFDSDSRYNDPDFWEGYLNTHDGVTNSECDKDNNEIETNYVADGDYRLVIVKKGSGAEANRLYWDVSSGDVLAPGPNQGNGQGYSHLITCTNDRTGSTSTSFGTEPGTHPSASINGIASCREADGSFTIDWTFTAKWTFGMTAVVYNDGQPDVPGFDVIGGPPTSGPTGNIFLGSYTGDGQWFAETSYGPDDEPTFPIRAIGTVNWDDGTYVQESVAASHILAPDDCAPEELANPTLTVGDETMVCNTSTGEYEGQGDGFITLNPFDNGSWVDSSLTNLSAGTYGPFSAESDAGYVFSSTGTNQYSSGTVDVGVSGDEEPCDQLATPVAPVIVLSQECGVQGSFTIAETEGVTYFLDGVEIAAGTHSGPVSGTITAEAQDGYELTDPEFSVEIEVPAAEECDETVTAVNPTVAQSSACEVEGSYTIPTTVGVNYLLNGIAIAAGTYAGPATGTITAQAQDGYELTNPDFSFALNVAAAEKCTEVEVIVVPPKTPPKTEVLPVEVLPFTGIDTDVLFAASVLLVGAGLVLIGATRKREN